jgi:hypothetical protein
MTGRKLILAAALIILGVVSASAKTGFGIQGNFNADSSLNYGAAITFKLNKSPWVFAADAGFKPVSVGITADNWITNKGFSGPFAYYLFWGVSGGIQFSDPFAANFGGRVGGGINCFLSDRTLELYLQGAWNPYLGIYLGSDDSGTFGELMCFPCAFGARVWF